ncbi:MAG: aminotransferase class I/II-fold pyridoxal phosphate-dependent enzyme [Thermoleophilia bacterium]|nr:aminotransferase class I/II-fold pyridoxal phosphate-dependent enzyme [Thermoleophilia bacterium]
MRARPARLERLPEQYFTGLLARVARATAEEGEPLVDLGRGNPEVGPPGHVVERLVDAGRRPSVHGYPPFRGLPPLREAIAARYAARYGVELDPEREVAVLPGTKTALVEAALATAERGTTILLPDPGYPDYHSGAALAGAAVAPLPLDPLAAWAPDFGSVRASDVAALYLNYPSNPCAVAVRPGTFADAVRFAERTGAAVVHDFAYGDLVFDGRSAESFLAAPGAREVGVELFSMSKSYGMAGWRLGFVVGNAELVERLNVLQDHTRAGVFAAVQEAAVAALAAPEEHVRERAARYERRRDAVLAALAGSRVDSVNSEATFYVWLRLPEGVTAERLLVEQRLAVAPGGGFGSRGRGWTRLSLAVSDETLALGLERLRRAVA